MWLNQYTPVSVAQAHSVYIHRTNSWRTTHTQYSTSQLVMLANQFPTN
jgi:hypothetical protein